MLQDKTNFDNVKFFDESNYTNEELLKIQENFDKKM